MTKVLLAAFRLSPAIVAAVLLAATSATAAPEGAAERNSALQRFKKHTPPARALLLNLSSPASSNAAPQIAGAEANPHPVSAGTEELSDSAEATSVSQLSDVQPEDWAFQALQSLVERYGAIAGYPDGTFRGNRAMTRYEFAAGLNAALERISQLIATGFQGVRQEDLATLQRLSTDFAAELATARDRVSALDARTSELEANQFSTTAKLNGLVTLNIVGASAGGDVRVERTDPQDSFSAAARRADGQPAVTQVEDSPGITFSHVTGLFLTASFSGQDLLTLTLAAGNGNSPANVYSSAGLFNTFGVPGTDFTPSTNANDLVLAEAFYSLPLSSSVQVAAGPKLLWLRYFDTNAFTGLFDKNASSFNTFGSTPMTQCAVPVALRFGA